MTKRYSSAHATVDVDESQVTKRARTTMGRHLLRREADTLANAAGRWGAPRLLSVAADASTISYQSHPGRTLRDAVVDLRSQRQQLSVATALDWLTAAGAALEVWHRGSNAVHGDVSPANLLLNGDIAYLIDFALATPFGQPVSANGHVLANRSYASPEQLEGQPVDARSDVYSLAVIAAEILSGKRFNRTNLGRSDLPLPQTTRALLRCALASDREARPNKAHQFVLELRETFACE